MKYLLFVLFSMVVLGSCRMKSGSGNIVTETRPVGSFTGLQVGGAFEVEIQHGPKASVLIEADDNLVDYIETNVKGSQLIIRMKKSINARNAHLKVNITVPALDRIKASAAADVVVMDEMAAGEEILLEASSAAKIKATVNAPLVTAKSSSGSTLELSGRTRKLSAHASSGGSIKAASLLSEHTTAKSSSGSSISVHASISLDAHASSGSDIDYRGAGQVTKSVSSGASIDRVN